MQQLITGIHHVTALTSDAQRNIDFYAGILGMRLVKKTVNFDAKEVYHFYYGDETGQPGSILTFFPYQGLVRGRHGKGMLNTTTFSVATNSLDYWTARLEKHHIPYKNPQERFNDEIFIYFEDFDGLGLELVFTDKDTRAGFTHGPIPPQHTIKGFYNVEIGQEGYERTAGLLTEQLDHALIAERGNRFRFAAANTPGNYVDIVCMPERLRGLSGSGTVHHIAFATPTRETQDQARQRLVQRQLSPTPVLDRNYFTSIYFREPGGVLFEIATAGPGFQVDESQDQLGQSLKLPPQFENDRAVIEKALPPVTLDLGKYE
jgi:glyoxalase family protein